MTQNAYSAGIEAAAARLLEMHEAANGANNWYKHAAFEVLKLRELPSMSTDAGNPASDSEDAALLSLEASAHEIFNNPASETSQSVRDVIEWYASSIRVVIDTARLGLKGLLEES